MTESTPRRVADAASSAAGDAASTAGDEAKRVAAEAKDQARSVVGEAKEQVSGLVQQARDELRTQSADRSRQAAGGLRTLSDQLQALTEGRPGDAGPLAGYVTDARQQVASFASRLEDRGIEGVVDDVARFARRRPGVFLLAAAGAGFVVGRFVRSGVSVARDSSPNGDSDGEETWTSTTTTQTAQAEVLPPPSSADDRDAGAVTVDRSDVDLAVEPKRPDASLGELFSEMTQNLGTLFRQEVELAKTEAKEEATAAGKASAMFVVGAVAAVLALAFLSAGLAWLLDNVMGSALAFALVGAAWVVIAAVLVAVGRRRLSEIRTLPETKQSIKEDVEWAKAQRS